MALHIYGIKNCNTVKKALNWFDDRKLDYVFHDYKKEPVTLKKLEEWENATSWESLLNKKGTTWRKLSSEEQAKAINVSGANALLLANNSMIKRPLIELGGDVVLGFDEEEYDRKFK